MRKVISLLLAVAITCSSTLCMGSNYASAKTINDTSNKVQIVTLKSAKLVAQNYIKLRCLEDDTLWDEKTKISNKRVIYNVDDTISAYLFYLKNGKKDNGYIVVSSDRNQSPILEYSEGEDTYFSKAEEGTRKFAKEKKGKLNEYYSKVYSLGGNGYALGG